MNSREFGNCDCNGVAAHDGAGPARGRVLAHHDETLAVLRSRRIGRSRLDEEKEKFCTVSGVLQIFVTNPTYDRNYELSPWKAVLPWRRYCFRQCHRRHLRRKRPRPPPQKTRTLPRTLRRLHFLLNLAQDGFPIRIKALHENLYSK